MSKTQPKHDANNLPVAMAETETDERAKARGALQPSVKEVQGGDLSRLEAMLVAQATTL